MSSGLDSNVRYVWLEVARDAPGQSGNSQLRNAGAEKGADQCSCKTGTKLKVVDWKQYPIFPGFSSPSDMTGRWAYNSKFGTWVRVVDGLAQETSPWYKLPVPTAPGGTPMNAAEWASFKAKYADLTNDNNALWVEWTTLREIAVVPPPVPPAPTWETTWEALRDLKTAFLKVWDLFS